MNRRVDVTCDQVAARGTAHYARDTYIPGFRTEGQLQTPSGLCRLRWPEGSAAATGLCGMLD